jgi:hemerythrin-like domain-containing protein
MADPSFTRRNFLVNSSIASAGLAVPFLAAAQDKAAPEKEKDTDKKDEDISPAEDLMREHGLLNRLLLIYDEHLRMLAAKRSFGSVLVNAAAIIRHFVEEYHEKLEEDFLFPRFRKAGKLVGLVDTLQTQHKAGRELTAKISELAGTATLKYVSSDSEKLADALREFLRMYRPHEAREDTVLFPAFPQNCLCARICGAGRGLRKEGRRKVRRRWLLQSGRSGSRAGKEARHLRTGAVHAKMKPAAGKNRRLGTKFERRSS